MYKKRMVKGFIWALLTWVFVACRAAKPIKIGFAGELTNRRGEASIDARDGALLAVDIINAGGGIEGRPLELIIKDDQRDPDIARQVDAELIASDVVAIIGHMSSEQTAAALDQTNQARVVLLSPLSSSSQFSGQADYFFRIVPSTDNIGKALAIHIYETHKIRRLAGVYDLSNRAFTETFWTEVQTEFEQLGGEVVHVLSFTHGESDLQAMMHQVQEVNPEGVVIVAPPVDTAMIAQYGRQQALTAQLFSSTWAQTPELLKKGGRAIEGLEMIVFYHPQNPYPAFTTFTTAFESRYHRAPTFGGALGYEAVLVLANALQETHGKADGLVEALVNVSGIQGVQGEISLDAYGDVLRDLYLIRVKDGQFEVIKTLQSK